MDNSRTYVGQRYVPLVVGEWSKDKTYEGLSIVTNEGNSFTSKKRVPIGIDLSNEEYWVVTGNYNEQIENYRNEVKQNSTDLTSYKEEISNKRKEFVTVNVKDFGAKGDGVTNDTLAFQNASKIIEENNGGIFYIPQGDYVVGMQEFSGVSGLGYAYKSDDIISITNCDEVKIIGHNARLVTASNLKYGSFDPVTSETASPNLPFYNPDFQASIGTHINIENVKKLTIKNIELDGNNTNLVIGGMWGDAGRQIRGYGVSIKKVDLINIEELYTHHHALDGLAIGYLGLTEKSSSKPVTLNKVISEYNGRQGFSWVGGKGLTAINCKFNHTGRGSIASDPCAGLDIEAEQGMIRDGLFINCEFANNVGEGVVAYSGDSKNVTFLNSNFFGTTKPSMTINKPSFNFYDCVISGEAYALYETNLKNDKTFFRNCLFSTKESFENHGIFGNTLGNFANGDSILEDCTFYTDLVDVALPTSNATKTIYKNCEMTQTVSTLEGNPSGIYEGVNKITVLSGVANLFNSTFTGIVDTVGTILGASLGKNGRIIATNVPEVPKILLTSYDGNVGNATNSLKTALSIPTSGESVIGDIVFNTRPVSAGNVGWICVESGNPGVWKSFGVIEA